VHELRDLVHKRLEQRSEGRLSITFESFGFKNGIPGDADLVLDARSITNPYWEPTLRPLTGRDAEVVKFLQAQEAAGRLIDDIAKFIEARVPEYQASNRGYLTVAVGCTGGQHRSVYIVDRLAERFGERFSNVSTRHSALKHLPRIETVPPPPVPAAANR
jgi:UPF0042 nucleotide-binding protein